MKITGNHQTKFYIIINLNELSMFMNMNISFDF